jgi:hypothetical protein
MGAFVYYHFASFMETKALNRQEPGLPAYLLWKIMTILLICIDGRVAEI